MLTASHCVHDKLPESLIIRAGEYDTQTEFEQFSHVDVKVKSYVVHPDYHKSALHRDVALIFLESPLKTAQNINFICLPPKDYNFTDKRCFASGWGSYKIEIQ